MTSESIERLIERLRRTDIYLPDSHAYRTLMKDRAEAADALESLRPKPEAGETPETDAFIISLTIDDGRTINERWAIFARSLERRCLALRERLKEREGMVLVPREPTSEMLSVSDHETGFRYSDDERTKIYKAMLSAAPAVGEKKPQ